MKLKEIYKNSFYKRVIDDSVKLITKESKKADFKDIFIGKKRPRGWDKLSDKEKFYIGTFHNGSEIISKVEALNHCIAFINFYSKTKMWDRNFLRADYIKYHLEVYYGNIIGISDRCLLLVNHLFDLGFKPRDAKYELISSNKHLKGERTLEILTLLNKGLQGVRSVRNYVAHQGTLSDKELDDIRMYEFLLKNSKTLDRKLQRLMKIYIKLGFNSYIREKKKEIIKNNGTIIAVIDKLFLSVSKKYLKKY